ncbi:MAG: 3-hydroxyacyl-CoA dehydrogenase family protein [Geminicoccaceae bacterium]
MGNAAVGGTVGIIGAGTMGTGIATSLAQHGFVVRLADRGSEAVERARAIADRFYRRSVDKGRMGEEDAANALTRIEAAELEGLAGCDLLIEAVFEDFDIKAALFDRLGDIVGDDTPVATNTSCLRVSDLAAHMKNPGRFFGLHYFSPAEINPIVEVIRGEATDPAIIERALAFTRAHGKQPITCKDSYGFAINRFFCPYTNEAARLLDEGMGTTAEIDLVAREALGAAAGPFLVMNLIKPRINLHAIRNLAPLGSFYRPADSMVQCGEADRSWDIEEAGDIDPERRSRIADRLRAGAFLPVLEALDEEIAAPADFDLGATRALKLGRPPCALMDELGADEVERIVAPLVAHHGMAMPKSVARIGTLVSP